MSELTFDETLLRSLIGPPIAFNRALVPVAGSIKAALLLSQMIYWHGVVLTMPGRSDGWFYKSTKEWLHETGMTRSEFDGARNALLQRGLAMHEVRGFPPISHYRVRFATLLANLRKTCNSACQKPSTQIVENLQSELQESGNQHTTKTTAQTTTQNDAPAGNASLPEWLPAEPWSAYVEMRRQIRAPLTMHGKKLLIAKLHRLGVAGQNVQEVLEQSIERSWRGLFPVRQDRGGSNVAVGNAKAAQEWLERERASAEIPVQAESPS